MSYKALQVIDALNEELTGIYYNDITFFLLEETDDLEEAKELAYDAAEDNAWEILKRMDAYRALSEEDKEIVLSAPITIYED